MFWFIFVGVVLAFGIISWIIYANDRVRDGWALTAAICTFVPIFIGFCLTNFEKRINILILCILFKHKEKHYEFCLPRP